jgi:outer membrane protein
MKKFLLLPCMAILHFFANAQEKKNVSLSEAINLGLQNNKQLKVSQARIDEATASLKEAVQKRLPDASVSGSYLRLSTANIKMATKSSNTGATAAPFPKIDQVMYGIVNASLPVYSGGRIRYGIEASRYLAEAAKLDADNEKDDVIMNTVEAYVNLYKAKQAVDLVKENLTGAQERVKQFSDLEKNGLLPRNELLKAELQSSNIELSLLDAENNWQLANVSMDLLLGLSEKAEINTDSLSISQHFQVKSLDEYVNDAYKQRKDFASLDLRKKAATTGIKTVKAEYYPSLALTGGYIAANIPGFISVTNALNLGVGVSYSIGSLWKTKAKVEQAEARAKQISYSEDVMNDNIRLQVSKAYLNFLSSQKKIDVYNKAVEQADENYRVTRNKYNNSLATTTELLDADIAQLQAKMNYAFAKSDAVVSYNRLLQAAGVISR